MKTTIIVLLLAMFAMVQTCSRPSKEMLAMTWPGSPEHTFETLVTAIQNKDLASYTDCWYAETAEREGMVTKLKENPKGWDELQAMFKGRQTLKADGDHEENGMQMKKFTVESPDVPKGEGIGSITMVKVGDAWKMYHW